jgi:signal transduction histidine kinase/ligand-binding sensor domain-containing protein/DNA-binding response OmpR family regulator
MLPSKTPIAILILLGLMNSLFANAALPEQYRFSHIDINRGLSNNQVKCFLKDSRGYLWIGTAAGLNRYDGYKLKVYNYTSNDTSSIVGNNIRKLSEGPEGEIWIQTTIGYSIYDPKTDRMCRNQESYIKKYGLPNTKIEAIFKDNEGNFWFIGTGQGITRYNPRNKTAVTLSRSASGTHILNTNFVAAIGQSSKGDFWIIHRNGMLEKLDKNMLKVVEQNEEIFKKNSKELYYALTVDSDDDLWIYLPDNSGGLFFFKQSDKSIAHFHKNSPQLQLNNDLTRGVVESAKGKIWVATDHGGINVIDKEKLTVHYVLHNEEVDESLAHNSINTLYKDDEGIIWVGTFKKGINFYHNNIIKFPHLKHRNSVRESLPYDDVNSFVEDDKGNLWIGTNGGGLLYLDRATGAYKQYKHDPADPNSLTNDVIVSLLIDKNKDLWIGTYMGGLDKFDGAKFTHYKNSPNDPHSLSDGSVWELFEDSKGNLWVGTLRGGLGRFDPQINGFHNSNERSGEFPLHCNYLTSIIENKNGSLWIAGGFGIDIYNRETRQSIYYSHDPRDPESLVSNHVMSIHKDSHDNIWIGTTEGLDLYNEEKKSFYHFTTKDGLPNNNIVAILEDNHHNLWLSTPSGLSNLIIDRTATAGGKPKVNFRNYDERDGLQGKAFNENSAYKTRNGELIFGGSNGFNIFYPDKIVKNNTVPQIVFTDFQLFNKSVEIGKEINGKVLLPQALTNDHQVTLRHNENVFSIEFAALNFFHPEKNMYRYKLEGFDNEWHTVNEGSRRVTYTNLDPGDYEFKVLASNNDGVWNKEGISMKIIMLAPFWRTKTAYALYAVAVFFILVLIRRVELQKARMSFQLEQERREARHMHELGLLKVKFFTNVSHEFRTPISLILAPIEKLLNSTTDSYQQKQLEMINRNAKRLLNLVNQLLDFRKLEVEEVKLHLSEGNVIRFIEESVHSFSDLSEKKDISLQFHTEVKELYASFDMDKLEKVLFNLLSNAFKFTPKAGKVAVNVSCFDNDSSSDGIKILEVRVSDTGIGIPKEKHEKIFERFFRDDVPDNLINQGSGIGLSITKEFVKIHGGMISIESEPGKGCCFIVTIPLREVTSPHIEPVLAIEEVDEMEEAEKSINEQGRQILPGNHESLPVILLVEDNEDFRCYLKDNLSAYFNMIEASNGKEGWQKALSCMPDLIVSDLMMPEMNGIDLCTKIKNDQRTSHIPFVLLTAHKAEELQLKCLDIGANDFVTKPFNFDILHSRIKNLITQREQLQKAYKKKISVQTSEVNIVSLDDKLIQNAIKVVEENLADPDFSVEAMSRELGMSRVHLYKKMVSLTGMSPVEFIRKIRLQRAAQLLEKSQLTVAEVAYKVGFNNRKYFTKYFKDEYNILPSAFAESLQQKV